MPGNWIVLTRYAWLNLLCLVGSAHAQQPVLKPADADVVCHDENVLLTIRQAQGVIYSIDNRDGMTRVIVYYRSWAGSRNDIRANIALAAYCRLRVERGHGKVEISDLQGTMYGTVVDCRWHDNLSGE